MKRTARIAYITQQLTDNPNKLFSLNYFCNELSAAKSTISEDISIVKDAAETAEIGKIITITGKNGGVKFIPCLTKEKCAAIQSELCDKLADPSRNLGEGFIYTSDLMFDPHFTKKLASIFAQIYSNHEIDYVVTIETKGLPLAFMTAQYLGIPTVVVRREPKISEGPTISINYFSGTAGRMKKMSISKKSIVPGSSAIIIDDFMRAGGSIKGICELLSEMNVTTKGIGVAIASTEPETKKVDSYTPLVYFNKKNNSYTSAFPNEEVLTMI